MHTGFSMTCPGHMRSSITSPTRGRLVLSIVISILPH